MSHSALHEMASRLPQCTRPFRRLIFIACSLLIVFFSVILFVNSPNFNYIITGKESLYVTTIRESDRDLQLNIKSQNQLGQACVQPELQLWHPLLKGNFKKIEPLECSKNEGDWVYVSNGSIFISKTAENHHGEITCEVFPLKWISDFETGYESSIKPLVNGTSMVSDFFEVACIGKDGSVYKNVHSGVHRAPKPETPKKVNTNNNSLDLNIMMIGFDSVSRMTWQRNLPKSYKYLVETLGGFVLEGYNIVGDGTARALVPLLTGKTEVELPEARRGHPDAVRVDGHPFIWKELKNHGYLTQFGEDETHIGTFQKRMLGFKNQPVDHYLRSFYLKSERRYRKERPYCLGSIPRHRIMLNYIKELYKVYPHTPKFSFMFHVEYSHSYYNKLKWVDDDLTEFLEFMHTEGHLDNTMLILMSDHGARFHTVRQMVQGKYEERMPFFSLRVPPKFQKEHPDVIENVRINTQRLTTPFDIHATFQNIINFTGAEKKGNIKDRGISLFREIPRERTCEHAGIEPHWCTCLSWIDLNVDDQLVQRAVNQLLQTINNLTSEHRSECVELSLLNITSAAKFSPGDKLLKFKKSQDKTGRVPVFSDKTVSATWYQVTVITKPSLGKYEATVKYLPGEDRFIGNAREISRTNIYGKQPHCITGKFPHLYEFCYCRKQLPD